MEPNESLALTVVLVNCLSAILHFSLTAARPDQKAIDLIYICNLCDAKYAMNEWLGF